PRSRALLEESVRLPEDLGSFSFVLVVRSVLANVARAEGRFEAAQTLLLDGLRQAVRNNARGKILHDICSLGLLAMATGDRVRGTRLIAVYASPTGLVGTVDTADLRLEGQAALAQAREILGDAAYDAAWDAGQAMTLEQAVTDALEAGLPAQEVTAALP
ncbi:MAG: hypothetical protein ACR2JY_01270, partial [Chloroflexota bacterium]